MGKRITITLSDAAKKRLDELASERGESASSIIHSALKMEIFRQAALAEGKILQLVSPSGDIERIVVT